MKKLLASVLTGLGILAAGAASAACIIVVMDEPEAPMSLLTK